MNHLGGEHSPYLQQHRDNPVDWYPWGEEAFAVARAQDKPIFLSIGYSTCYWCHVMERDSFEDEGIAEQLNRDFISIKVDREERPDVDQLYMQAVLAITGRGGWPLSVFLTPALEPFWGGTFFPRDQFSALLKAVHASWQEKREEIGRSVAAMREFLQSASAAQAGEPPGAALLRAAAGVLKQNYDEKFGGFGSAPKFPPAMQLGFLLRMWRRDRDPSLLAMVEATLEKMARGGIYDHIGGGFHRYALDQEWGTPHFEKMLYDNALLASVYLAAYQATQRRLFSDVARETFHFVLRDLHAPEGGFYAALDAGEVGQEGEGYVWSIEELQQALRPDELAALSKRYGCTKSGNFEGRRNVLRLSEEERFESKYRPELLEAHEKLLILRKSRAPVGVDRKIITAWNGLMIAALADGSRALEAPVYLDAAVAAADFITGKLMKRQSVIRSYCEEHAGQAGCLEDYAFLVHGLLCLYQASPESKWLRLCRQIQAWQDEKFWDPEAGGYFTSEAEELIVRQKELVDGAVPSGNSIAALNLLWLAALYPEADYGIKARRLVELIAAAAKRDPAAFPCGLQAVDTALDGLTEAVILRSDHDNSLEAAVRREVDHHYVPNTVLVIGDQADALAGDPGIMAGKALYEAKSTLFVCRGQTCQAPLTDPEQAAKALR